MYIIISAELLANVRKGYQAKYARYNTATSRFEISNDNVNWTVVKWPYVLLKPKK